MTEKLTYFLLRRIQKAQGLVRGFGKEKKGILTRWLVARHGTRLKQEQVNDQDLMLTLEGVDEGLIDPTTKTVFDTSVVYIR